MKKCTCKHNDEFYATDVMHELRNGMSDKQPPIQKLPDKVSDRAHNKMIPMGSTFHELFSGGASVWLKIAGGAIATPVVMAMYALRAERRGGNALPKDPSVLTAILVACVVVGAAIGAALCLKDVVHSRLKDGRPVAFPARALFGYGMWSLLLVWFPGIVVLTLLVTLLTL